MIIITDLCVGVVQAPQGVPPQMIPSVHLPSCLKPPEKKKVKVVCTYFKNSTLFQVRANGVFHLAATLVYVSCTLQFTLKHQNISSPRLSLIVVHKV